MKRAHYVFLGTLFSLLFFAMSHEKLSDIQIFSVPDIVITTQKANLFESQENNQDPITILFVGDVMLGRAVESLINKNGIDYPFMHVRDDIQNATLAIANFEGIVTEKHIKTPSMGFDFSIKKDFFLNLSTVGFDVLSLANNHSDDFANDALLYTRTLCAHSSMICGGDPNEINEFSTKIIEAQGVKIGIIFIQALYSMPDMKKLSESLDLLNKNSEFQIAYVHWGDEYELIHNSLQEELAHILIDEGVDAVVGHHPHVTQDISIYKNKPIFYSLGNYIFDQYFSEDVMQMAEVLLELHKDKVVYTVIPISTKGTIAQPYRMSDNEKSEFLQRLFKKIYYLPGVNQDEGTISTSRS